MNAGSDNVRVNESIPVNPNGIYEYRPGQRPGNEMSSVN